MLNTAALNEQLTAAQAVDRSLYTEASLAVLDEAAASLARMIPCTACRYCCAGCPMGLDIPGLLSIANDLAVAKSFNVVSRYTIMDEDKKASACIGCGQCETVCPQKIHVPEEMQKLAALMETQKTWEEICAERAAIAEAAKKGK